MRPISFLLLLLLTSALRAQQTDYDAIIQPLDAKARDFSEYLVQLAWLNSPEGAISMEEVKNTKDEAQNTRKEWLRDIQVSFNLNEGNLRPATATNNAFFPKYNLALNLNVYNILTQKNKSKIGTRDIRIAELEVNRRKLAVRAETLARYANYKLAKDIYQTRSLAEQEMNANFILVEQLYKTDEKTFDEYTLASTSYYQAKEARIKAETDIQLAKFQLEAIIGLKWEQVQHPAKDE
ncbi:MAG: TolC family protein [Saprospiraceae bacterium]